MKLFLNLVFSIAGAICFSSITYGQAPNPVQYVKICQAFGAGWHYIPGTDTCMYDQTGDTVIQTETGVWYGRGVIADPGHLVSNPQSECGSGHLLKLGTYVPSDFTAYNSPDPTLITIANVAPPVDIKLQPGEYVSKIMMSGGFGDPLQPLARSKDDGEQQFCVKMADPSFYTITMGGPAVHPPFCKSGRAIGCVSNQAIKNAPAAYSISVVGVPDVSYNTDANGNVTGQPLTCGSQLVITSGTGRWDPRGTVSGDPATVHPYTGTMTAWACIDKGIPGQLGR